jgi:enoyl-CoA hydratase
VLVGLLRATEKLPVMDALFAESLAYAALQGGPEYRRWLAAHRAPAPFEPTDAGPAVVLARARGVLTVELNRASNRNAINVEMRDGLVEAFELALADRTIRRVVLRGRGRCFSTGGDLTEFGSVPDPATGHAIRMQVLPARFLAQCAERVEARVHSACIGAGIELPAFARRIVAAPDAFFQLPELGFGLIPGAGGTVSIPRRIGRQRAAWLMLSGKKIGAQQALAWGLVDAIAA